MHPDCLQPLRPRAQPAWSRERSKWLTCCATLALAACQTPPELPPTPALPPAQTQASSSTTPEPPSEPATVAVLVPTPSVSAPPPPPAANLLPDMLSYSDRLRSLGQAELTAEQALIGDPGTSAERLVKLALVLLASHQTSDTVRAIGLLQRAASLNTPDAMALRPLVRLLSARLQEIRRLEEQLDRQTQQLREAQRRIDTLSDRLEAMRAIERSLLPRPARPGSNQP